MNIDFISPQQDLIAEAILTGLAASSTCPESTPGFDVLSSEIPIPVESIASISKLPKSNNYWTNFRYFTAQHIEARGTFGHVDDTAKPVRIASAIKSCCGEMKSRFTSDH